MSTSVKNRRDRHCGNQETALPHGGNAPGRVKRLKNILADLRTNTYDAPEPIKQKKVTPGELPPSRIPIYDAHGNRRGHVGHKASAATVARFGVPNAKLGTRNGRTAWIGKTLAEVSAEGTNPAMPAPTIGGSK